MNLFQIGLLFSLPVHTYNVLTYLWNRLLIDFYLCVYDRVCKVPCVLSNICVCERKLIFLYRVLSFIFYWFGMVRRKLTIPERWQAVGMHNGGFSHRRVADHFRDNHSIIVRLMQRFRQTGNVTFHFPLPPSPFPTFPYPTLSFP
jgi:hypothetical protein